MQSGSTPLGKVATLPPVLYHYTGQDGLLGIIESKTIWASKIQYLNDFKEFELGLKIAGEKLAERTEPVAGIVRSFIDGYRHTNTCVCSFSEEGDLLSQWRGYSAHGAGFSIGFDPQQLQVLAEQQDFVLSQCEYSPRAQRELIASSIDAEIRENSRIDITELNERIAGLLLHYCAQMKDPSFSEEREWRLISEVVVDNANPNFCFRKGQSVIVPYYKFKLGDSCDELPIKEVVIGPTPHPELAIDSLAQLSSATNIKFSIRPSVIPYRNW